MIHSKWNIFLHYVRTLFKGALHICDKCGRWMECYEYGPSLEDHYKYVEKTGVVPGFKSPVVKTKYYNWKVCIVCCSKIDDLEEAHRLCCKLLMESKKEEIYHGQRKTRNRLH